MNQPNPALMHTIQRETKQTNETVETTYKRADRFFIGQQGYLFIVWHVTEMPELYDSIDYLQMSYLPAKDGTTLFVTKAVYDTLSQVYADVNEEMLFPKIETSIHLLA